MPSKHVCKSCGMVFHEIFLDDDTGAEYCAECADLAEEKVRESRGMVWAEDRGEDR